MIITTDRGQRLNGWYRGKVIRHEEFGKCKIYIPGVYPEECKDNPDLIPSAEQVSPIFGGSVEGNGIFTYPYIGAIVICGFLNEDQNQPFYIGTTLGGEEAQQKYKDVKPMNAFTHIIHIKNTDITIKDTGDVKITTGKDKKTLFNMTADGNVIVEADTNITLHSKGTMDINADTQLNIKSPMINIKGATQTTIDSKYTGITGKFFSVNTDSASLKTPVSTIIQTTATTQVY